MLRGLLKTLIILLTDHRMSTDHRILTDHLDAIYCIVNQTYEPDRVTRLLGHILNRLPTFPRERIVLCAPTWGSELSVEDCFRVYNPWAVIPGWPVFTWKSRCLLPGEISLVMNFYYAMADAVAKEHKCILILESDVFLRPDFEERLLKIFSLSSSSWDFISLSDGIGTHASSYTHPYMEQVLSEPPYKHGVARCTDSMLFKGELLKKMVNTFLPFRDCLDWHMNYQLLLHNAKSLWAEPPLVEQGTTKGRTLTTLPA